MTIPIPSGSMTPARFGARYGDSGTPSDFPNYATFGGRIAGQMYTNKDDYNTYGFKATLYYRPASDIGTSLEMTTKVNGTEAQYIDAVNGAALNSWQTSDAVNNHINSSIISSWQDNQDPKPRSMAGEIKFKSSATAPIQKQNLYAICINYELDTERSYGSIEPNGRHPATGTTAYDWTPQDENESCSAWVMKQQVCNNTNVIMQETRGCFTVPLFDHNVDDLQ